MSLKVDLLTNKNKREKKASVHNKVEKLRKQIEWFQKACILKGANFPTELEKMALEMKSEHKTGEGKNRPQK